MVFYKKKKLFVVFFAVDLKLKLVVFSGFLSGKAFCHVFAVDLIFELMVFSGFYKKKIFFVVFFAVDLKIELVVDLKVELVAVHYLKKNACLLKAVSKPKNLHFQLFSIEL